MTSQSDAAPAARPMLQRCPEGGQGGHAHPCTAGAGGCDTELQRAAVDGRVMGQAPASVHEVIRSPGRPLDARIRAGMESRLGHDFSRVRVHSDGRAGKSAAAVGAAAYTVGKHIVFAPRRYAPDTAAGGRLIAHELTHVVQQHGADTGGPILIGPVDSPAEGEAHRIGAGASDRPARLGRATVQLQRAPACLPKLSQFGFSDEKTGTDVHNKIKAHFIRSKRLPKDYEIPHIPAASSEPYKDRSQIFDPVFGGYGVPDLAARSRDGRAMLVAEIKPGTINGALLGEDQLKNYIDKGNDDEALKAELGVGAFAPMLSGFYRPPRVVAVTDRRSGRSGRMRRFRAIWCGPGLIVYMDIKPRRRKKKKDKRRQRAEAQRKHQVAGKATTRSTPKRIVKPKLQAKPKPKPKPKPRATVSAKAANLGIGISIGSSGAGGANISLGISISSNGIAVGTVSAGIAYDSGGAAVGAVGAGAAVESQSAAALAAGAGISQRSTTAGVLVAGTGSMEDVIGAAALQAEAGSVQGPPGGAEAGVEQSGATEAGGESPADAGVADIGIPAPAGVPGDAPDVGVPVTGVPSAGGPLPGSPEAGAGGGQVSEPPVPGEGARVGVAADIGGRRLAEIVARLNLPAAAGTPAEVGQLLVDAAELDQLVNRATPAQVRLLQLLAQRSPEGVYAVPRPAWVSVMLAATAGITDEDLEYLAGLEWRPARVSAGELRKNVRQALDARRAAAAKKGKAGESRPDPELGKATPGKRRGGGGGLSKGTRKRKQPGTSKPRDGVNRVLVDFIRKFDYSGIPPDSWRFLYDSTVPDGAEREMMIVGIANGIKYAAYCRATVTMVQGRIVRIGVASTSAGVTEDGQELFQPDEVKEHFTAGELDQ